MSEDPPDTGAIGEVQEETADTRPAQLTLCSSQGHKSEPESNQHEEDGQQRRRSRALLGAGQDVTQHNWYV